VTDAQFPIIVYELHDACVNSGIQVQHGNETWCRTIACGGTMSSKRRCLMIVRIATRINDIIHDVVDAICLMLLNNACEQNGYEQTSNKLEMTVKAKI